MKKLLLFLIISVGTISPLKAELSTSTKAALALGAAGITTAAIYAWNQFKEPATFEQILAQGETILSKGAQYESIISLLMNTIDINTIHHSPRTFSKETLAAAETLNLQEILALKREAQAHLDILLSKTDQSSKLIPIPLAKQFKQMGDLCDKLSLLLDLALIAECKKTLDQDEFFQPAISLLQKHSIHSPSDVSENALSDFYEYTSTLKNISQHLKLWQSQLARLNERLNKRLYPLGPCVLDTRKLIWSFIQNTMITQREWMRTMLPQLKVIAQVYEAHEGYFLN